MFDDRPDFINSASSEKITLAHIDGKARLYTFSGPVLDIYTKEVPYFVNELKQDDTNLVKVDSLTSVVEGTFYYDIRESTVYARLFTDSDPKLVELIVTYRFFFADKSITLTHDLENISEDVHYEGRIVSSPGYRHKIGIDQALTSLIGEGDLQLKNPDTGLDNIFDRIIFENQDVTIYSYNPELSPDQSRAIYRGKVTNKVYEDDNIKFKIKDQIFSLLDSPSIEQYTEDDNVAESSQGQFKRRVYGRVDGLKVQSTDQIGNGYKLTGTVSIGANSNSLGGLGTQFLTELVQDDNIIIGTQDFTIEEIIDDTNLILSDEADFSFSGQDAYVQPTNGTALKNRIFLATGHICAEVTHNIVSVPQFNRVQLDDVTGLFEGDFLEFNDTSERLEIKTVAPNNIIVLRQNMVTKPAVATTVTRKPIQEVYVGNRRVNSDDYSIQNTLSGCGLTLQSDVEFNLARSKNSSLSGTFTNGSRVVTVTNVEVTLDEVFTPGDWVKPDDITYSTFYKVINVKNNSLELSSVFLDPTISDLIEYKKPVYIQDDTVVSVNILGKTVDNTANGVWISNAAQVQRDLIEDIGITVYNSTSFSDGEVDSPQLISLAIPEDFTTKTLPTVKTIVDNINKSVHCSLTLDNDLKIKYKTLNVVTGENIPTINDSDVITWKINSTNGKTYKRIFTNYRFSDVDLSTLEKGSKALDFESQFISRYIGTNKVDNISLYLYETRDAIIATHRHSYYNRLSVSTLTLQTDLRLENIEIGEIVIADFRKLYTRFGSNTDKKKVMLVIGKALTGQRTELILSDLGNTFNTSSFITPNDAPEWTSATDDQKLIYGYITDNQGIVNDEEITASTHLIS